MASFPYGKLEAAAYAYEVYGFPFFGFFEAQLLFSLDFLLLAKAFHANQLVVLIVFDAVKINFAFASGACIKSRDWHLIAFFITALYGASDEFHQKFVFGRNANLFDWVADSVGAAIGVFIIFKRRKLKWQG